MGYKKKGMSMRYGTALLAGLAVVSASVNAAPNWQWANQADADTVALYHFDESRFIKRAATVRIGVEEGIETDFVLNDPTLNPNSDLEFYNFIATGAGIPSLSDDIALPVLGNKSVKLSGAVQFRGYKPFGGENGNTLHLGDLTMEAWVKFEAGDSVTDLRLGTSDGSIRLYRDPANPANDSVGYMGSHDAWLPHKGFDGFDDFGIVPGKWFHVAMTVHSAGRYENVGHFYYNAGSYALLFLNGKLVGVHSDEEETDEPHVHYTKIELDGTHPSAVLPSYHATDRVLLRNMTSGSTVYVDELTLRSTDLSNDGSVTTGLFLNGGANGTASAENWMLFE